MVGVAVKVTEVPVQIVVLLAAIETEGGTVLFTTIIMALLIAVTGILHGSLLLITTVTTLPLANAVLVNVAPV